MRVRRMRRTGKAVDDWKISCQAFQGIFKCQNCGRKFRKTVRFKQYFDHVAVSEKTHVIIKAKTEIKRLKKMQFQSELHFFA